MSAQPESSWPPPSPKGRRWIPHVVVDVCVILAVVALVLWADLPASTGAAIIVTVQAGYIAQAMRRGPPAGVLVLIVAAGVEVVRRLKA